MILESELEEVRRKRGTEWENTKHHLKLAKADSKELGIVRNESIEDVTKNSSDDLYVLHA